MITFFSPDQISCIGSYAYQPEYQIEEMAKQRLLRFLAGRYHADPGDLQIDPVCQWHLAASDKTITLISVIEKAHYDLEPDLMFVATSAYNGWGVDQIHVPLRIQMEALSEMID